MRQSGITYLRPGGVQSVEYLSREYALCAAEHHMRVLQGDAVAEHHTQYAGQVCTMRGARVTSPPSKCPGLVQ